MSQNWRAYFRPVWSVHSPMPRPAESTVRVQVSVRVGVLAVRANRFPVLRVDWRGAGVGGETRFFRAPQFRRSGR